MIQWFSLYLEFWLTVTLVISGVFFVIAPVILIIKRHFTQLLFTGYAYFWKEKR